MIVERLQQIVIVVLGIILLATIVGLGHYYSSYNSMVTKYNDYVVKVKEEDARDLELLRDLRERNAQILIKMKEDAMLAREDHKRELDELKNRYDAALRANDGLRQSIINIDTQWSTYDDTTRQNYARAGANNTVECSEVTAKLEQLAYGYNSEVVYLRSIFPKVNVDGSLTAYDPKTGAARIYGAPIELKGVSIKDIRQVATEESLVDKTTETE